MNRIYISLVVSIVLSSCAYLDSKFCAKVTPITLAEDYYLVLNKKPEKWSGDGTWYYDLVGKDLNTQRDTLIKVYNYRWHDGFTYYWDKGDTLVKKKDSLIVEIRKKDTIYFMEWQCGNPLINGVSFRDFKHPK
ncbi:hypothetical protein HX004_13775 [Myroides sp. 1354]|uniref:hypothetical protein n=1 Tax=unclassified Myroides TaxID=2642485 RepID=UPI0025782F2E|nr:MULTISPECIES: hypothetical protein [unclassified Myroides]MDM1044464.1 hypothetical protein [Myroides sp. R163-1]MDM1056835.1 hypothetical protein [Myroides sp. 1354]MDM1069894.1 hypothetical protein [Myroides sp. 1372]